MLFNSNSLHINRQPILDQLENDVLDLFTMHLTCVFFINEHYMASSDYMDYLECGLKPETDSQYWVAPAIQKIFDEVLEIRRPDVCAVIKDHSSMHLE